MSRIALAFSCFFQLLFRARLPADAAAYLPEEALPRLPEAEKPEAPRALGEARPPEALPGEETPPAPAPAPSRGGEPGLLRSEGALVLLSLLQREGRLVDFLRESLESYDDASIGAAVRDIHRGCKKVLEEHLRIEPVMPGQEETPVTVPKGFDPGEVRIIGKVDGGPPFQGVLVHHGWRAVDVKLPTLSEGVDRRVLAPAEVRL
jgi:hypothetical protein